MILLDMVYRMLTACSYHVHSMFTACRKHLFSINIFVVIIIICRLFRYYYALVRDVREELVETCANLLAILFNYTPKSPHPPGHVTGATPLPEEPLTPATQIQKETGLLNLFIAYLSRLHQTEVKKKQKLYQTFFTMFRT